MELTVNTFGKGLLMDTHPMMLGTDSLSDALNATLVTMNGNEVILQNDMGNRKVVNAVLPDGYEPVGIKEYGGVIYVASYNPLTNKSQIGSFPSPQRLISGNDKEVSNINWPDGCTDTVLISLGDLIIHAGDKFIIYGFPFDRDKNKNNISNYNNVSGNKIISPKNKLYTLAIGVLNSRNEFVDITSDLIRWDLDRGTKAADNGKSLLDFNRGYFIKESKEETTSDTIKDKNLKDFRTLFYQIEGANTYSHKLVSPLYLQIKLNHVEEFNYNIYGYKEDTKDDNGNVINNIILVAEGFVTYNCPDGFSGGSTGDSLYESYEEGALTKYFFDFNFDEISNVNLNDGSSKGKCTYNPQTNLYSVKQVIAKTIRNNDLSNNNINYTINVKSDIANDPIGCNLLPGFTSKGTIDVEKLGSGKVELKGFRFINNSDNEAGTLTIELEAYPKYDEPFDKLILEFWDCSDPESPTITITALVYNGRINIPIDWKTRGLESRTLYNVDLYYTTKNNSEKQLISDKEYYLTTELLNKYYFTSYNLYKKDFKDITSIEIKPVVYLDPIYNNSNPIITSSGSMLTKNTNNNKYLLITKILLNIDVGLKISYNLNLYPRYLDDYFTKLTVSNFDIVEPNNINIEVKNLEISNDNKITGNISLIDEVSGNFKSISTSLINVFDSVGNYFSNKVINKNGVIRLGMFMGSVSHRGPDDHHEIFFSKASGDDDYITLGDDLFCINSWKSDNTEDNYKETTYNGRASRYDIDSYFSLDYDDKVFTVVFKNDHDKKKNYRNENYLNKFVPIDDTDDIGSIYKNDNNTLVGSGKMLSCRDSARLLWKTSNGHTAFVDGIIIKKNRNSEYSVENYSINSSNFIDLLNQFYFCREKTKPAGDWKLLNITKTSEYRDIDVFANIEYNSYNNSDGKSLSDYLYRLKFTLSKTLQTKELFLCNIKSSEEFYDYVNNFEPKNLIIENDNVYLLDLEGNELDPSGIYLKKLNGLYKKLLYPPFFTYTTELNENQVLLSNPKKDALKYFPHDFGYEDDGDSETWLSYDSVWKVDAYDIYKLTQS